MKVKQFEVWIADLNPMLGTEPGKVRPVIVVQTDLLNKTHLSSLICPITTNVQPGSEILRVHLPWGCCGLNEACDIMIDQLKSIDNKRLLKKTGMVSQELAMKVKSNLKIVLDLD